MQQEAPEPARTSATTPTRGWHYQTHRNPGHSREEKTPAEVAPKKADLRSICDQIRKFFDLKFNEAPKVKTLGYYLKKYKIALPDPPEDHPVVAEIWSEYQASCDWDANLDREIDPFEIPPYDYMYDLRGTVFDAKIMQAGHYGWKDTDTFTKMPPALASDRKLSLAERGLAFTLACFNLKGDQKFSGRPPAYVFPSNSTLCAMIGCSEPTLIAHKKRLEVAGYIVQRARKDTSNLYYFTFPRINSITELIARFELVRSPLNYKSIVPYIEQLQDEQRKVFEVFFEILHREKKNGKRHSRNAEEILKRATKAHEKWLRTLPQKEEGGTQNITPQ